MTIFKYKDSPIEFEEDYLGTGMTRVSTWAHGELGFIWETSNGAWSACVGEGPGRRWVRRVGNQTVAFKWLIENQ